MLNKIVEVQASSIYTTDKKPLNNTINNSNSTKVIKNITVPNLLDYIPVVDVSFEHTSEYQGRNTTNGITHSKVNQAEIGGKSVDVSKSYLLPVTTILNFSNSNITVRGYDGLPKTIFSIKERIPEYDGKIFIITTHNLLNPKSVIYNKTETNQIEQLITKYKDVNERSKQEILVILKMYKDKIRDNTEGITIDTEALTIKINTVCVVDLEELSVIDDNSMYIVNKDLVISLKSIIDIPEHPRSTFDYLVKSDSNINDTTNKNNMTFFIIDEKSLLRDKFISIINTEVKVPVVSPCNTYTSDGLYVLGKINGETINKYYTLEEVEKLKGLFNSKEEITEGTNLDLKLKKEILLLKTEAEKNKSSYDEEIARINISSAYRKSDFESQQYFNKGRYEGSRFEREFSIETIKTIGLIGAGALSLYLLFTKFNKA